MTSAVRTRRRRVWAAPGPSGESGPAEGWTPVTERLAAGVASASAVAGIIHLVVTPEHLDEHLVFGAFFSIVGALQLIWARAFARTSSRMISLVGIVGSAAIVAIWALSRTIGLPVGPEHLQPETPGILDLAATAAEIVVVVGAWLLLSVERSRSELAPTHRPTSTNSTDVVPERPAGPCP